MGIVDSCELWATNTDFLNDSKEIDFAFELAQRTIHGTYLKKDENRYYEKISKEKLESILLKPTNQVALDVPLEYLKNQLSSFRENACIYVVCFSTEKDDLNQWRAYSRSGNGYAIGFNLEELSSRIHSPRWQLIRCIYSKEEQQRIVCDYVDAFLREFDGYFPFFGEGQINQGLHEIIANEWARRFTREIAPSFKHECFSSEREWRLVLVTAQEQNYYTEQTYRLKGPNDKDPEIRFRSSDVSIIPYMSWAFETWEGKPKKTDMRPKRLVDEFVIRPHVEIDYMKKGLEWYLKGHDLSSVVITDSELPFRSY